MEETEDPFAFIIKNCMVSASQEEKLRNCPFARQSEDSLEHSNSVTSSPAPSEQPAIFMVSPPGSDSSGQNSPRKNDEHAASSSKPYLSGSDHPRPSETISAVDSRLEAPVDEPIVVDDDDECTENRKAVDLGKKCGNLGFQKFNLDGGDFVNKVWGNNGHGSLKANKIEPPSKRNQISEKLRMQSPMPNKDNENVEIEIIDLECEEIEEKNMKSPMQESNSGGTMFGEGIKACENCRKRLGNKSTEDLELLLSMKEGGEEEVRSSEVKDGSFMDLMDAMDSLVAKASDGGKMSENCGGKKFGGKSTEDLEQFKNVRSRSEEVRSSEVKDGSFMDLMDAMDSVIAKASGGGKMSENCRKKLGGNNSIEDLDQFKNVESGSDDVRGETNRGSGAMGKRKLPLSMSGGKKRARGGEEEEVRKVDMEKRSFKDMMGLVEVLLVKTSDGHKDVGSSETAKWLNLDFIRPRWWPPEGFPD